MFRRYEGRWQRFAQPDPYDGSYDLSDPQSLNRYAYTQNDPVNFVDPSGLDDFGLGEPPEMEPAIDPEDTVRVDTWAAYYRDYDFLGFFLESWGRFLQSMTREQRNIVRPKPIAPNHIANASPLEREKGPCGSTTWRDLDFGARRPYDGRSGPVESGGQHIIRRHINPANAQTAGQYNTNLSYGGGGAFRAVKHLIN